MKREKKPVLPEALPVCACREDVENRPSNTVSS